MGRKVILTPPAIDDLRVIVEYIAIDNPHRALSFGEELLARMLELGEFPKSGRVVPEFANPAVRELIHKSYRIVYKMDENAPVVYVARVWHSARGKPDIG